jgi:hypothetical protein
VLARASHRRESKLALPLPKSIVVPLSRAYDFFILDGSPTEPAAGLRTLVYYSWLVVPQNVPRQGKRFGLA